MIHVKFRGTLGNQLWQYSVGRILAEQNHLMFLAPKIPGFSEASRFKPGRIELSKSFKAEGHCLPKQLPKKRIILDGHFERFEYIQGYRSEIQRWFRMDAKPKFLPNPTDLVVSIRRGKNGWPIELCPTSDYYVSLMNQINADKIWICTDSPEDSYFDSILKAFPQSSIVNMTYLEQFNFIKSAKQVVMAPSTFTFWATYLGNAERVYWPRIQALNFDNTPYNWFPTGDPRMIWI